MGLKFFSTIMSSCGSSQSLVILQAGGGTAAASAHPCLTTAPLRACSGSFSFWVLGKSSEKKFWIRSLFNRLQFCRRLINNLHKACSVLGLARSTGKQDVS